MEREAALLAIEHSLAARERDIVRLEDARREQDNAISAKSALSAVIELQLREANERQA